MDDPASDYQDFENPASKLVLIVDDDANMLDMLEHAVKQHQFKTERASEGAEAVRKARSLLPNLIILDFVLPDLSGFDIVHQLQEGETASIPILVVTGRKFDPQNVEMMKRGSNIKELLEKPVQVTRLMLAVHRILRTRPPSNLPGNRRGW